MTLKERYAAVMERFAASMPSPETELHYDTPFHLLVAVILSAQCTDKRVNIVTPALFEAYPTAESMAVATPDEIFPYIKSISYPNNKAKSLVGAARTLVERFDGGNPIRYRCANGAAGSRAQNSQRNARCGIQPRSNGCRYPRVPCQ